MGHVVYFDQHAKHAKSPFATAYIDPSNGHRLSPAPVLRHAFLFVCSLLLPSFACCCHGRLSAASIFSEKLAWNSGEVKLLVKYRSYCHHVVSWLSMLLRGLICLFFLCLALRLGCFSWHRAVHKRTKAPLHTRLTPARLAAVVSP